MDEVVRKLASVRKIEAINPIEGADNIVCATVDGWKLVTQKSNNFQPGDLVVYFEIDSFLPEVERFEFLRTSSYRKMNGVGGFRIKTIKLRGQISQGLILPMSDFFQKMGDTWVWVCMAATLTVDEGFDLTEELGVKKWEAPIHPSLVGKARGNFPEFIRKTDQERIQNVYKYFSNIDLTRKYEVTLKLDGSSMTAYCKSGYVGVCSRNLDLIETEDNTFWKVARSTRIVQALESYSRNIAIQGELMGPGIQGNREKLNDFELYVFDIYDIDNMRYMSYDERNKVVGDLKSLGAVFNVAPVIETISLNRFNSVDDYLQYADRPSINHQIAEGVVFKNIDGERHSFKVINNKFLLKEKD